MKFQEERAKMDIWGAVYGNMEEEELSSSEVKD